MDTCRVCGTTGEMKQVCAREMMYGTKEEFDYFICPHCGCMQIKQVPTDLSRYYGGNYYSYAPRTVHQVDGPKDMTRVLDVGCGSGDMLCQMAEQGMGHLVGCDPFIDEDLHYENGVNIYKCSIHEIEGEYDFIYLNDSFEHMTDPHEVMESIRRLLAPKGVARIKIPVFPNLAWDMFGSNWYQLDAPRHIFLHSRESMRYLAEQHGLQIVDTRFDSNISQIICSFFYEKNISYYEQDHVNMRDYFDQDDLRNMLDAVDAANKEGYGDHAMFYLMKQI
ncbi:MAG: class I SAM-dependent methyltransferase [Lachnospiraceae bacterium]|nr:class I SAM-dependent methyltransferase [Lachnospiraceae bacterium]